MKQIIREYAFKFYVGEREMTILAEGVQIRQAKNKAIEEFYKNNPNLMYDNIMLMGETLVRMK